MAKVCAEVWAPTWRSMRVVEKSGGRPLWVYLGERCFTSKKAAAAYKARLERKRAGRVPIEVRVR